ncbi:MAG: GGDEF domain-containing protein, partial [Gemmatimonadota bacterium]
HGGGVRRGAPASERSPRFPPFRDQETGLHSREGFDAVASGELKRCRRYDRVYSILMLQLPVDESEALRRAAGVVRRSLRESDLVGRHVDRTLAVALPETSVEPARRVSRRLVTRLDEAAAWGDEGRIGIATHPVDGETLLALLDTARGQLALPADWVLDPAKGGAGSGG